MIVDSAPLVNQFVSVPANLGALDCAALMAGVVAGILGADSASVSERFRTSRCVDGVFMGPHRLDALDVAVRESTRLDGVRSTQTAHTSPPSVPPILEKRAGPCSSLG